MGAATKHKQALLKTNPYCIFCGGTALATTVEHCPPRALFQNRQWPERFEFAACHGCNGGTSDEDLLLSMLARMNPFDDSSDSDGKTEGIVRRVVKQFPGIFSRMELSAAEARRNNRKLGITPAPGQLHQEAGVVRVPPEMTNAVCTFSSKLAKAVYFLHSQRIFPVEGCLLLNWFTNVHLYEKGHYPMLKQMEHFDGLVPDLVRTGRHLNDQFSYKLTMDRTHEVFALQTVFGKAFGTVVFGSREPGKLEATFAELKRKFPDKPEPFSVLQSSVLPVTRTPPETASHTAD